MSWAFTEKLTFKGEFTRNWWRGQKLPKKVGLGQFAYLKERGEGGAWQERGGWCFPQCTLCKSYYIWVKIVELRGRVSIDSSVIVMHYQ